MSNLPPNVPGNVTPHKLLSFDEMTILQEHYRLVSGCHTQEARNKALKGWNERQLRVVAGLIGRLLHCGFVIEGQHESGALYFGVRLKCVTDLVMELPDKEFAEYQAGRLVWDQQHRRFVRVGERDAVQA